MYHFHQWLDPGKSTAAYCRLVVGLLSSNHASTRELSEWQQLPRGSWILAIVEAFVTASPGHIRLDRVYIWKAIKGPQNIPYILMILLPFCTYKSTIYDTYISASSFPFNNALAHALRQGVSK